MYPQFLLLWKAKDLVDLVTNSKLLGYHTSSYHAKKIICNEIQNNVSKLSLSQACDMKYMNVYLGVSGFTPTCPSVFMYLNPKIM